MYRLVVLILLFFMACKHRQANETTVQTSNAPQVTTDTITTKATSFFADSIDKENAATIRKAGDDVQRLSISLQDSLVWLQASMRNDHRVFGYSHPDTGSQRMILFSIFTNDVQGNPHQCPYGSYYQVADMGNRAIRYQQTMGDFIKCQMLENGKSIGTVYFLAREVKFEE